MRTPVFVALVALSALTGCASSPIPRTPTPAAVTADRIERVTTGVPFPRGVVVRGDELFVLSRGRVRDAGGTDVAIDDLAGTIWKLPLNARDAAPVAIATPASPPFRLLDRLLPTALDDHHTDRPYCILRLDPATQSLYFCAFSGIDKPLGQPGGYFRKNRSDAVFRFDLRTGKYHLVARGGLLDGPTNCLVVGKWLYVSNKEASTLLRYDLSALAASPGGVVPPPELIAGKTFLVGGKPVEFLGHSALAARDDGYLYLGFRTSSTVVRIAMRDLRPRSGGSPVPAQLLAQFEPYDPVRQRQSDLTDMAFGPDGDLYVIGAKPARIWRLTPNPRLPLIATFGSPGEPAWAELHALTQNPKMKIEALTVDPRGNVYVTSADKQPDHAISCLAGTVYRITNDASR